MEIHDAVNGLAVWLCSATAAPSRLFSILRLRWATLEMRRDAPVETPALLVLAAR
jgi:hypothetical protein